MTQPVVEEMTSDDDDDRSDVALVRPDACDNLHARELIAGQILIGGVDKHHVDLLPLIDPAKRLGVVEGGNQLDVRAAG